LGLKGGAFRGFFKGRFGAGWEEFLKAELKSDNTCVPKLAYKCMKLENMEFIAYKFVLIH
jgi:hypothetical protein